MDKLPELILKLLENSSLTTLFSGVLLLVISGAGKLPFFSTISPTVQKILLVVGIILIAISPFSLLEARFSRFISKEDNVSKNEEKQEVERYKQEVLELQDMVDKIKCLVKSRDDNISQSIRDILNGIEDNVREFEIAREESLIAAKWLVDTKQQIFEGARASIMKNDASDTFYSEVEQYFGLIVSSLENFVYIEPERQNVKFHINKPFPYIRAIRDIKVQIDRELNEHQELSESETHRLHHCIDKLIENIRRDVYSSS